MILLEKRGSKVKLTKVVCENCGGNIEINNLSHINNQEVTCSYCGATYIANAKHWNGNTFLDKNYKVCL